MSNGEYNAKLIKNLIRIYRQLKKAKTNIFPILIPDENNSIKDIKNLIQLPTKQKINGNTIITKELIESFKYTPEELKLINDEQILYEKIWYNVDLVENYENYDRYSIGNAIDIQIIKLFNSVYAFEHLTFDGDKRAAIRELRLESILERVKEPYIFMLRILANQGCNCGHLVYYYIVDKNSPIRIIKDVDPRYPGCDDPVELARNRNDIIDMLIGKTVKECFEMIDMLIS